MNLEELSEDSDTSDEDYNPETKQDDIPSEVDSDGEPEDPLSDSENPGQKGRKRTKRPKKKSRKKHKELSEAPDLEVQEEPKTDLKEEDKKKMEEDLWADFMKDTGFQSKSSSSNNPSKQKPSTTGIKTESRSIKPPLNGPKEKVKVTQIFEFAGEEVRVEKEVAADSAEARLMKNDTPDTTKAPKPRGGLSGIGSVLSQLGKKAKISTLEKTKLDWDKFKKDENIEEELQTHNKGKDGYLERQDFLQRADVRRFEIEREIRSVERSKRLNN